MTDDSLPAPDAAADLPRPSTFDQAITALSMAASKHPKNRILPELRERAEGGPLRSGDLKAFAAILTLWRDSQSADMSSDVPTSFVDAPQPPIPVDHVPTNCPVCGAGIRREPIDMGDNPNGPGTMIPGPWYCPNGCNPITGGHGPVTTIQSMDGTTITMNATGNVTYLVEPHTGDPFTGPAPIVETAVGPLDPDLWLAAVPAQPTVDPFTGPAPVMETTEGAITVPPSLPAELGTPAPKAPARSRRAPRRTAPKG